MSSKYTYKSAAATKHPQDLTANGEPRNGVQPQVNSRHVVPSTERDNEHPIPRRGTPSTQSPEEFYLELTQREDVQAILRELAKQ